MSNQPRSGNVTPSSSEHDEQLDEEEDEVPMPYHRLPPSPEVPASGKGIWLVIALVAAGILGYPAIQKFDAWWDAKLVAKVAAEKEIAAAVAARAATPELECKTVQVTAQRNDGKNRVITEACLPKEAWAYYAAQGLGTQDSAMNAGIDFIQGEQPWRN